ncbi:replication initiation and membrane attachment family protein [Vagococcus sp.]|uniref:replication initiation and membrane attachment family protein n=1 Tax=Vagococcus sp. TaxID=1933889 RepID=UPI003F9A2C9C
MTNAWEKLKPKDQFSIRLTGGYNEVDYQTLTLLYQPLIGTTAFSLLTNLLHHSKVRTKESVEHAFLFDQLDIGLPNFYAARSRLEAIGLLRTYTRQIDQGHHFIYLIMRPVSPELFLTDDVMALLLLDKIGENSFKQLVQLFKTKTDDLTSYSEITQNFTDVFTLDKNLLSREEPQINSAKEALKTTETLERPKTINLDNRSFDWDFFRQLMDKLPVNLNNMTNQFKKTIDTFHYLYGINELEMQQYVISALDVVTNQVNLKDLKQLIYRDYHNKKKQQETTSLKQETLQTEKEQNTFRKNTLKREKYTAEEIEVILSCEHIAPLIFLKSIKEQKGGYVANNERWTVENIRNQSGLPDSVINMLIHYCLVGRDETSLNQNMMNSIANDWVQKKLFSPEAALSKVKEYQEESQNKYNRKTNYSKTNGKSIRQETLPEWAKSDEARVETPLSSEEQTFFEEQLKKVTAMREGEK